MFPEPAMRSPDRIGSAYPEFLGVAIAALPLPDRRILLHLANKCDYMTVKKSVSGCFEIGLPLQLSAISDTVFAHVDSFRTV